MKKNWIVCVVASFLIALSGLPAYAQKQLVSGTLKKQNGNVKIAAGDGHCLIVWSQGKAKKNSYGRIYATELIRQPDGSYTVGEPFLVSPKSGSNQRPDVVYLDKVGKYLIAWDTSLYDLTVLLNMARPFPPSQVLARTYTPSAAASPPNSAGVLGDIFTINDEDYELSVVPIVVPIVTGASVSAGKNSQRVFINYLSSDEEKDGEPILSNAGMWGSTVKVKADGAAASGSGTGAAKGDISRVKNVKMTSWELLGVLASGFYFDGNIYATGAFMDLYGGIGRAGIFRINTRTFQVETFLRTDDVNPWLNVPPMNIFGQVLPLDGAGADAAAAGFTMAGVSNLDFNIVTVGSDLSEASLKKIGAVSKKANELVDQRLFMVNRSQSVGDGATPSAKRSNVYVLFHTKKGQFRYRNLTNAGKPKGASKSVLRIKKNLVWMDVDTSGKDVLLAFSEKRKKKRYEIYFLKFNVK